MAADDGIARRGLLLGAAGVLGVAALGAAGVETGVLPGRGVDLPAGVPHDQPGRLVSGSFRSARRRTTVGWTVAYPPGVAPTGLPVLVVLHGRGQDHRSAFGTDLHLDRYLARAVHAGTPPFAIAAADGGDHEYWHPRRGTDPAGMITDEFMPLLAHRGLDVRRIGLLGWSMGGYGALYLATVLGRARCAVAVAEPGDLGPRRADRRGRLRRRGGLPGPHRRGARPAPRRHPAAAGLRRPRRIRADHPAAARDGQPHPGRGHRAGRTQRGVLAQSGAGTAGVRRPPPAMTPRRGTHSAPTASSTSSLTSKFA